MRTELIPMIFERFQAGLDIRRARRYLEPHIFPRMGLGVAAYEQEVKKVSSKQHGVSITRREEDNSTIENIINNQDFLYATNFRVIR